MTFSLLFGNVNCLNVEICLCSILALQRCLTHIFFKYSSIFQKCKVGFHHFLIHWYYFQDLPCILLKLMWPPLLSSLLSIPSACLFWHKHFLVEGMHVPVCVITTPASLPYPHPSSTPSLFSVAVLWSGSVPGAKTSSLWCQQGCCGLPCWAP